MPAPSNSNSVVWKRIEARITNQGESFHMEITRGMFDYIETTWELPSNDEVASMSLAVLE